MFCHNSKYHLHPLPARSMKDSPFSPHLASILCRNETQTFWRSEEGPRYNQVRGGFSVTVFQVRYLSSYSTRVPTQTLLPAEVLTQHIVSLCTWAVTLVGLSTALSHIQKTYWCSLVQLVPLKAECGIKLLLHDDHSTMPARLLQCSMMVMNSEPSGSVINWNTINSSFYKLKKIKAQSHWVIK